MNNILNTFKEWKKREFIVFIFIDYIIHIFN